MPNNLHSSEINFDPKYEPLSETSLLQTYTIKYYRINVQQLPRQWSSQPEVTLRTEKTNQLQLRHAYILQLSAGLENRCAYSEQAYNQASMIARVLQVGLRLGFTMYD